VPVSNGEFAMSEFGDLEDLALLMFGMICLDLLLLLVVVWFVIVCGGAVVICRTHVYGSDVLTGSASILAYSSSPALAITGRCSIGVLQGFVFDVGVGVGGEAPDAGDLLVHVGG
jgi:hypothetical protein